MKHSTHWNIIPDSEVLYIGTLSLADSTIAIRPPFPPKPVCTNCSFFVTVRFNHSGPKGMTGSIYVDCLYTSDWGVSGVCIRI